MNSLILQTFRRFRVRLDATGIRAGGLQAACRQVKDGLDEGQLPLFETFLAGSYARQTLIASPSQPDIDLFVVLHPSAAPKLSQSELIQFVGKSLKARFKKQVRPSQLHGRAAAVEFSGYQLQVIPIYNHQAAGYLLPLGLDSWVETDPRLHTDIAHQLNQKQRGTLAPLVKMVKYWNRSIGQPFYPFHLEALAWKIFERAEIPDLPAGLCIYFDHGRDLICRSLPDPATGFGNLGAYIHTLEEKKQASARFLTAYHHAHNAMVLAKSNEKFALAEWGKIFGRELI